MNPTTTPLVETLCVNGGKFIEIHGDTWDYSIMAHSWETQEATITREITNLQARIEWQQRKIDRLNQALAVAKVDGGAQ